MCVCVCVCVCVCACVYMCVCKFESITIGLESFTSAVRSWAHTTFYSEYLSWAWIQVFGVPLHSVWIVKSEPCASIGWRRYRWVMHTSNFLTCYTTFQKLMLKGDVYTVRVVELSSWLIALGRHCTRRELVLLLTNRVAFLFSDPGDLSLNVAIVLVSP